MSNSRETAEIKKILTLLHKFHGYAMELQQYNEDKILEAKKIIQDVLKNIYSELAKILNSASAENEITFLVEKALALLISATSFADLSDVQIDAKMLKAKMLLAQSKRRDAIEVYSEIVNEHPTYWPAYEELFALSEILDNSLLMKYSEQVIKCSGARGVENPSDSLLEQAYSVHLKKPPIVLLSPLSFWPSPFQPIADLQPGLKAKARSFVLGVGMC